MEKHHGDPLDELSRLSILLGGVGDHPGEWKKRPSALHFRYEYPRTAPLVSAGALLECAPSRGAVGFFL